MRLLSHPFRLGPRSAVATVEQGTDGSNAELLAALVLTRPGERVMVPDFGVPDPAFGELQLGDIVSGVELFGPPIRVTEVVVGFPTETTERADVTWE